MDKYSSEARHVRNLSKVFKKPLLSTHIKVCPLNDGCLFVLDVDASDVGIEGILHQIQEGRERVISFASRASDKVEKNYCSTEKELLAFHYFVEYFR